MLLTDYLAKKLQFTVSNDAASDESNVLCRVPQCSILGPLLFLL